MLNSGIYLHIHIYVTVRITVKQINRNEQRIRKIDKDKTVILPTSTAANAAECSRNEADTYKIPFNIRV